MAKDWSRQTTQKRHIVTELWTTASNREQRINITCTKFVYAKLESVINTFQLSQEFRREIMLEEAHLRVCRRINPSTALWQLWNIIH